MVMTVDLFERLNRHAKIACSLPHVAPPLHEPRRRCVTKRVRDHVLAEPCCSPRGVPRPAQLADLAALVMTDEADAQLSVDPVPSAQETWDVTRDGVQRLLVGEPKDEAQWGTGLIPGDDLVGWGRRQGVPDALDNVIVNHVSGGKSVLGFKAYEQGRTKWQSETLDFIWFDEEPPQDIYFEGLTRTNATEGIVWAELGNFTTGKRNYRK